MAINVFLVEDHEIVRQGIKSLLEEDPEFVVAGEAVNGEDALEKLKTIHPDIVLMDINMPVMDGLSCTRILKTLHTNIKILILSMHDDESFLIDMLDAGADGYILKNSSKDEMLFAIRKIMNDGIYMAPEFTLNILNRMRKNNSRAEEIQVDLTNRERDVLELIAEGMTNQEIAEKLFSSVRTVETQRKKILKKTGTKNTATLIRFAVSNGLIS